MSTVLSWSQVLSVCIHNSILTNNNLSLLSPPSKSKRGEIKEWNIETVLLKRVPRMVSEYNFNAETN